MLHAPHGETAAKELKDFRPDTGTDTDLDSDADADADPDQEPEPDVDLGTDPALF